jgi:hypothetical protein
VCRIATRSRAAHERIEVGVEDFDRHELTVSARSRAAKERSARHAYARVGDGCRRKSATSSGLSMSRPTRGRRTIRGSMPRVRAASQ